MACVHMAVTVTLPALYSTGPCDVAQCRVTGDGCRPNWQRRVCVGHLGHRLLHCSGAADGSHPGADHASSNKPGESNLLSPCKYVAGTVLNCVRHGYSPPPCVPFLQLFGARLAANEAYLAATSPQSGDVTICTPAPRPAPPLLYGWQSPGCSTALAAVPGASSISLSQLERAEGGTGDAWLAVGAPGVGVIIFWCVLDHVASLFRFFQPYKQLEEQPLPLAWFAPVGRLAGGRTGWTLSPNTTLGPGALPGAASSATYGAAVALHPTGSALVTTDGSQLRLFNRTGAAWALAASLPLAGATAPDAAGAAAQCLVFGEGLIAFADPSAGAAGATCRLGKDFLALLSSLCPR
jgi:hypothetical protein